MSDLLTTLVAFGGNSHFARSARAKLQWRDRYGRFIEMGKGVKFKFRRHDGSIVSARGVFVGTTDDPSVGQLYVSKDPNGLPDGFYNVSSGNAQEILASIDPNYLASRGIVLGQHADGGSITDRGDADIPNQDQIPFSNAPTGWKADSNGGHIASWTTDDNEFVVRPTSFQVRQRTGNNYSLFQNTGNNGRQQNIGNFKDWPNVLSKVNQTDDDRTNIDNQNNDFEAGQQQAAADQADLNANLADPNTSAKDKAKAVVKPYDTDGTIANLIDNNGSSKDVLDALSKNPNWKRDNDNYNTRDAVDHPTALDKQKWDQQEAKVNAITSLDNSTDAVSSPDTNTGHNLDLSVGDVAADGYLVPTNGNLEEHDASEISNMAQLLGDYVDQHKSELTGGGKRLSVLTKDDGSFSFDVVDQVPDHNAAQQLASERNSTEIYDVANNKVITTSQGRPRNDGTNANPDSSALEPVGNDDGSDRQVGSPDGTADSGQDNGQSDSGATDSSSPDTSSQPADDSGSNSSPAPAEPDSSPASSTEQPADSGASRTESSSEPRSDANTSAKPADSNNDQAPGVGSDGLPDDPAALDRMVKRLEAKASRMQDDPKVDQIEKQLDDIYAKIDKLQKGEDSAPKTPDAPEAPREDAPAAETPNAPEAPATPEEAPAAPAEEPNDQNELDNIQQSVQDVQKQLSDLMQSLRDRVAGNQSDDSQPATPSVVDGMTREQAQNALDAAKKTAEDGQYHNPNPNSNQIGTMTRSREQEQAARVRAQSDVAKYQDILDRHDRGEGVSTPARVDTSTPVVPSIRTAEPGTPQKPDTLENGGFTVGDRVEWTNAVRRRKTGIITGFTQDRKTGETKAIVRIDKPGKYEPNAGMVSLTGINKIDPEPERPARNIDPNAAPQRMGPRQPRPITPEERKNDDTNTSAPTETAESAPREGEKAPETVQEPTNNAPEEQPADPAAADPIDQDIQDAQDDLAAANRMANRARQRGDEDGAQRYEQEAADIQQDLDDLNRLKARRERDNQNAPAPVADQAEPDVADDNAPEAPQTPEEPEAAPATPDVQENAPEEPTAAPEAENAPDNAPENTPEAENAPENGATPSPEQVDDAIDQVADEDNTPGRADFDAPLSFNVNDTSPDGSSSNVVDSEGALHGEISLNADGTWNARQIGQPRQIGSEDASADFPSREEAEKWLGDRIAGDANQDKNVITGDPVSTPDPNIRVYQGSELASARGASQSSITNLMAGKNLSPEDREKILSTLQRPDLNQGMINDIRQQIAAAGNRPDTQSRPRENNPANYTEARQSLVDVDPGKIVDPNLIMQDVKRNHNGYDQLANGDVIVESRTVNGKKYDVIIRRTGAERFFPYVRETNLATGEQRAFKVGDETHSYKALRNKMNRGKAFIRQPNVDKAFARKRRGVENLPANGGFDSVPDPARDFIEHTNLAKTGDEHTDKLAAMVANLVHQGEDEKVLRGIAKQNGLTDSFVDSIRAAVVRKRANDENERLRNNELVAQKSHIPFGGGDALKAGDWVDWTDYRPTLDIGKPSERPNPNFGRVYRGQVRQLRYKTNDGNGQYVYSDSTYVVFPELNREAGRKPSLQRQRISSQLKKVDGPNAAPSAPFFAKKEEKQNAANKEAIVKSFNLPENPLEGESLEPVARKNAPAAPQIVEPDIDINGNAYLGGDDHPVAIPQTYGEVLDQWNAATPQPARPASALNAGDLIMIHDGGAARIAKVISINKNDDGSLGVGLASFDRAGNIKIRENDMHPNVQVINRRPVSALNPVAPAAPNADKNPIAAAPIRRVGDRVYADDIPGGVGEITDVSEPDLNGERSYIVKADLNGMEYPRQERYLQNEPSETDLNHATIQPVGKQEDQRWMKDDATDLQKDFIKSMMQKKKLTPASRAQLTKALNDPTLTKGQASKYIDELKNYQDRPVAPGVKDNPQGITDMLRIFAAEMQKDPESGDANHVLDGVNAAEKERADLEDAPTDRDYGGYAVRAIGYSQVRVDGDGAPFEYHSDVVARDLQPGDIISRGIGKDSKIYYQVLENDVDGNSRNLKLRYITSPNGQWAEFNHKITSDTYDRDQNVGVVYRPTANAPKGYYKTTADNPRNAVNAPGVRNDYDNRAQDHIDRVQNGYEIKTKIAAGAINEGAWYIQPNDNGPELFMKKVSAGNRNREWHNEIVVSKMLNKLGMTDVVVTGLDDKRTIIQDKIPGKMAYEREPEAYEMLRNGEKYKNFRLIGLIDYLTVNSDRHMGNWFVGDNNEPIPIDHGYTWFNANNRVNSPFATKALGRLLPRNGNNEPMFSKEELVQMKNQIGEIRDEFLANNNPYGQNWYTFVMGRFDSLISEF